MRVTNVWCECQYVERITMRPEKTSCLSGHKRTEERVRHQRGWVMSVMCRVYCDHCEPLLYMRSPAVSIPSCQAQVQVRWVSGLGQESQSCQMDPGRNSLSQELWFQLKFKRELQETLLPTYIKSSKLKSPSKFDTNASQASHRWHHWLHCHHNRSMIVKPFWWAGCRQYVGHTSSSSI